MVVMSFSSSDVRVSSKGSPDDRAYVHDRDVHRGLHHLKGHYSLAALICGPRLLRHVDYSVMLTGISAVVPPSSAVIRRAASPSTSSSGTSKLNSAEPSLPST